MTRLHQAILKTLVYADIFDYPLTVSEIHRWLIWPHPSPSPSLSQIKLALKTLKSQSRLHSRQSLFFLPSRPSLVKLRHQRQRFSQSKRRLARRLTRSLHLLPTVKLIALTGALSMNNSDQTDDIDLLIITSSSSLWFTRPFVLLFLQLLGHRRRPHSRHFQNLLCPNLFLDESSLSLPASRRQLYTAHEILQIQPLWDRGNTYQKFLSANSWVKNFLPHAFKSPSPPSSQPSSFIQPQPLLCLLRPLNLLAFKLQYLYMKPKITHEKVSPSSAFFHPRQTSKIVLKQYHQKLKHLQLS